MRYRLEISERQLQLIAACVEDICRFMSGQCELSGCVPLLDDFEEVREILRKCEPHVTHQGYGVSFGWNGKGCKNEPQRKFIAETYYIYREILHFLAMQQEQWSVYQSETLRCENSGEVMRIERITENEHKK